MPPTAGPTTADIPHTLAMYPCTRARSATEYRSPTTVMLTGWIAPAPRPWTARPAMSTGIEGAAAHRTDPARKRAIPQNSTGRRPKLSASRPYSGVVTAEVSR